jgi:hypothetical protein
MGKPDGWTRVSGPGASVVELVQRRIPLDIWGRCARNGDAVMMDCGGHAKLTVTATVSHQTTHLTVTTTPFHLTRHHPEACVPNHGFLFFLGRVQGINPGIKRLVVPSLLIPNRIINTQQSPAIQSIQARYRYLPQHSNIA